MQVKVHFGEDTGLNPFFIRSAVEIYARLLAFRR